MFASKTEPIRPTSWRKSMKSRRNDSKRNRNDQPLRQSRKQTHRK